MIEMERLIAKQQLRIQQLSEELSEYENSMINIQSLLFSIGSPLNDSTIDYTKEQRKVFYRIEDCLIIKGE